MRMENVSIPLGALRLKIRLCVAQDLGEVVSSMNKVNRNLESLVEVGRDIERVSDVWLSFHSKVSCQ